MQTLDSFFEILDDIWTDVFSASVELETLLEDTRFKYEVHENRFKDALGHLKSASMIFSYYMLYKGIEPFEVIKDEPNNSIEPII